MPGALLNGDLPSIFLMIGLECLGLSLEGEGKSLIVFPNIDLKEKKNLLQTTKKG